MCLPNNYALLLTSRVVGHFDFPGDAPGKEFAMKKRHLRDLARQLPGFRVEYDPRVGCYAAVYSRIPNPPEHWGEADIARDTLAKNDRRKEVVVYSSRINNDLLFGAELAPWGRRAKTLRAAYRRLQSLGYSVIDEHDL